MSDETMKVYLKIGKQDVKFFDWRVLDALYTREKCSK